MRGHWAIENNLHWLLDMTFREDGAECEIVAWPTISAGFAGRLVLTLLKQHPGKDSIAMKRRLAGWGPGVAPDDF
ncbi:MAG: hypothetical protein ABSA26_01235 [Thermoguttaceae bacterium]